MARTYEQVRAILCKTTTWNYNVYRLDDNLGIQLYSFNSLYLISRRTHISSYSVLCQNYTTRTRWDNYKQTQLGRCLFPSDFFLAVAVVIKLPIRELTQPRRRLQQERHKFAYLIEKNNSFARFARAVFIFDISQTFSFFLRREMTGFAVVWTT